MWKTGGRGGGGLGVGRGGDEGDWKRLSFADKAAAFALSTVRPVVGVEKKNCEDARVKQRDGLK